MMAGGRTCGSADPGLRFGASMMSVGTVSTISAVAGTWSSAA